MSMKWKSTTSVVPEDHIPVLVAFEVSVFEDLEFTLAYYEEATNRWFTLNGQKLFNVSYWATISDPRKKK